MFWQSTNDSSLNPITGTTRPILVPRGSALKAVRPGKDYFLVQIHSAQAAFTGHFWEQVKRLVITSQVNLNHPNLGDEALRSIQRSREVKKDRAEQLGLSPNLIRLVPATMSEVSLSIDFVLDKANRLAQLSTLVNDDSFLAAISLAPGPALVAKTISGLAKKVITSFIPAEEYEAILQFGGEFNLATDGLFDAYYVILGTRDEKNPLPRPMPKFEIRDGELLANNEQVTQLSYVIFDIRCTEARTRDLNEGALWETKLRDAERMAQEIADGYYSRNDEVEAAWNKSLKLLQEAHVLLLSDPNYLRREAESIYRASFRYCKDLVLGEQTKSVTMRGNAWLPDEQVSRGILDIPLDEDLNKTLAEYAEKVTVARKLFRSIGIH